MGQTYYDSSLTDEQIQAALDAIDGLIVPANNGKAIAVSGGKLVARSVTWGGGSPTLQSKTVTPGASQQFVLPDLGYDGLSDVTVNGDADLVAANIKKDVEIFGVTGTYEGSGGGSGSVITYSDLFRYICISASASDRFVRGERWFQRNTNEPVIFMAGAVMSSETMQYTGYCIIHYFSTPPSGTYSSYGELAMTMEKTTPNGTHYWISQMAGSFPPSVDGGAVKINFNGSEYSALRIITSRTTLMSNFSSFYDFEGDSSLVSLLNALIDEIYNTYYAT